MKRSDRLGSQRKLNRLQGERESKGGVRDWATSRNQAYTVEVATEQGMRQYTRIKPSPTPQGRLQVTGDIHKAVELLVPLFPSPFFICLVSVLLLSSFVCLYDEFWSFPSLFFMPLSLSQTYSSLAAAMPTFVSSFLYVAS